MIKKLKFKKLGTLVMDSESVRNSELNLVLADGKALTLHAALDSVNLFEEGLPSKGKHHSLQVSCVTTVRGDMVPYRCEDHGDVSKGSKQSVGSKFWLPEWRLLEEKSEGVWKGVGCWIKACALSRQGALLVKYKTFLETEAYWLKDAVWKNTMWYLLKYSSTDLQGGKIPLNSFRRGKYSRTNAVRKLRIGHLIWKPN